MAAAGCERARTREVDVAVVELEALRFDLSKRAVEGPDIGSRPEGFDRIRIERVERIAIVIEHGLDGRRSGNPSGHLWRHGRGRLGRSDSGAIRGLVAAWIVAAA